MLSPSSKTLRVKLCLSPWRECFNREFSCHLPPYPRKQIPPSSLTLLGCLGRVSGVQKTVSSLEPNNFQLLLWEAGEGIVEAYFLPDTMPLGAL